MIEAFLLNVFVGVVVYLTLKVGRKSASGQQPALGIFSYKPEVESKSISEKKMSNHA